jgi:hypothetical protein
MVAKLSLDYVQEQFKNRGCTLLEKEYTNAITKMRYICKCHNESVITWNNFSKGKLCMKCKGKEKLTLEYIKNKFLEKGCLLLESDYINSKTSMKYLCICKNEWKTTWSNFNRGHFMCKFCADENTSKNSFQFKDYTLPSKKNIRIQGYENLALDELLTKFDESELVLSKRKMPIITYYIKKEHRYYPDIFIPKRNTIIEVKSEYTYKSNIIRNMIKALSVRKLGYNFEFWIYDKLNFKKTII